MCDISLSNGLDRGPAMLDLNDFRYFVRIVECGGVTAASRNLNVPKSTVSHRLQQLETSLGVRLVNRTSRSLSMTDVGDLFYRHAVAMLERADLAESAVRERLMEPSARALLIEALRDAHRWLDELLSDPRLTFESLASREGRTVRSIRMTLSLAFLAPEIVKAAVEGRLPRGFGLKRLVDLPIAWPDQWRALGLQAPAQA